ncbi:outer membrane protein assembly factor BamB family protein [Thermococcus sp. PK]|uniref:outer membrane protein assembly factor BamB family protein n=1 Tax=Thermococcus sp. PK TaxID=913025 RepID=UPI0009FF14A5|nr:PQQ-binding-like beta-propeller repeat protein [Thermococcus sp. PK]
MKKSSFRALSALLIVMFLVANPALATEWLVYKNNSHHTGVATEAIEPPLELLWKFETGGSITSSPVVSDGVLYFGSADYHVYALDSLTGELKWKFKTNGRIDTSPALWNSTVYVASLDGNLYALDAKTGNLKWKFESVGQILSSPVVEYGLVFFGATDGSVYALNATTGQEEWVFKTGGKIETSPAVYGQLLIVGSYDGKVYALEARSGILVWTVDIGEPVTCGAIVADTNTIYFISGAKYLYAAEVASGNVTWKKEIALRDTGYTKPPTEVTTYKGYTGKFSPSVLGGTAYVVYYRNLYKVNAWTGKSWREDHYYFQAVDTQNGQTKWQFEVGGPIQNAPVVSGATVFFGSDDGYLYGLHVDTGELKWKYLINTSIRSSPVIANRMLYIGADDGHLYAFASEDVISIYSDITSTRQLVDELRAEGISIPSSVEETILSVENLLRVGDIDSAKSLTASLRNIQEELSMINETKHSIIEAEALLTQLKAEGVNNTEAERLLEQAKAMFDSGDYTTAKKLTEQAVSLLTLKNGQGNAETAIFEMKNLLGAKKSYLYLLIVISVLFLIAISITKTKKTRGEQKQIKREKAYLFQLDITRGRRLPRTTQKNKKTQKTTNRLLSNMKDYFPNFPSELLDKYEPLEFLGEGGFAKVYKVKRKSDGKVVALKIPRIDEKTSSLFLKEIAAWYYLNHPNIVKLYKADIFPIPYLEMEYVEGAKIDDKIVRDLDKYPKPVDENTALKLIVGIAEGLKHAHSKGIWHLDLKPLNVLLKRDLTPKITDWGLAKISTRSSLSTNSGYSPLYAAPEQLDEETYGVPDHRTDIYGLGIIFYELLTGKLPYEGYSPGAVVGKILAKDIKPTPPSKINPALAKYDGIFEKLLAKRKEDRYQSIEEFLQALNALEALHKEREELKKSLKETKQTLKKSRSKEEIQKLTREAVEKTAKIALLSARLNDKAELLNALEDLKVYTKENLDELLNAISQVEVMIKEAIPLSDEFVEGLRVLLHRIEKEV